MNLQNKRGKRPEFRNYGRKIIIWLLVLVLCIGLGAAVLRNLEPDPSRDPELDYRYTDPQVWGRDLLVLYPGQTLTQTFPAMGQATGMIREMSLEIFREKLQSGGLLISLEQGDRLLLDEFLDFSEMPQEGPVTLELPRETQVFSSHEPCVLTILNVQGGHEIGLRMNRGISSGRLEVDGEAQAGFLNLRFLRKSIYTPNRGLLMTMMVLTGITVLTGLGLVLFTRIRVKVLYLLLAVGFGVVMLFDLTPLYGFDMFFQFDSAYVVSNRMMGLGGPTEDWSQKPPVPDRNGDLPAPKKVLFYERRACDDYSQYQRYYDTTVSDNYADAYAGLKNWSAGEEDRELVLAETDLGFLGEQLYLYIPQALGFTIARLLHLGMVPMIQLARILTYALFVFLTYRAIAIAPFGKRVLLVLALVPTVMVQTVSISRDGVIFALSFYLIARVLAAAYGEKRPSAWDWAVIIGISALLAPCKMIYLPLSFFWLLVIWRKYLRGRQTSRKEAVLRTVLYTLTILLVFILANIPSILRLSQTDKAGLDGLEAYTLTWVFQNPMDALYLVANTFRTELGSYFTNAIQLFDIRLGSSDTITLVVGLCLVLAACEQGKNQQTVLAGERWFFFLVGLGVLVLVTLASLQWTPMEYNVIKGLQGRYLTPVLPLLCMTAVNNRALRGGEKTAQIVDSLCCLFPALVLLNMYLWTVRP